MGTVRKTDSADLDRRELQSTIFACAAIAVMGIGSAFLMYPVVFAHDGNTPDRNLRIAFFGFCGLCVLLTAYVWDSHATIRRLRHQMEADRKQSTEARQLASEELLKSIPKLSSFQDQFPMEYRRTTATNQQFSILVVWLPVSRRLVFPAAKGPILGDAAKAIARKLRDQDSIYILGNACFGAILPGLEASAARSLASRVGEGLIEVAG